MWMEHLWIREARLFRLSEMPLRMSGRNRLSEHHQTSCSWKKNGALLELCDIINVYLNRDTTPKPCPRISMVESEKTRGTLPSSATSRAFANFWSRLDFGLRHKKQDSLQGGYGEKGASGDIYRPSLSQRE